MPFRFPDAAPSFARRDRGALPRLAACAAAFLLAGCYFFGAGGRPKPAGTTAALPFAAKGEAVVVLHGLAHSSTMVRPITDTLLAEGYRVCPIDYPSRTHPVRVLTERYLLPTVRECFPDTTETVHFVAHSLGAILVRQLEFLPGAPRFGRVVMIAPPNHGTQVVDRLGKWDPFDLWSWPAARELGTGRRFVGRDWKPPSFEFAVIAGTYSVEPRFSSWMPGPDDGKVSVSSAKLDGMRAFDTVPASHNRILRQPKTKRLVVEFLREGRFDADPPVPDSVRPEPAAIPTAAPTGSAAPSAPVADPAAP